MKEATGEVSMTVVTLVAIFEFISLRDVKKSSTMTVLISKVVRGSLHALKGDATSKNKSPAQINNNLKFFIVFLLYINKTNKLQYCDFFILYNFFFKL